MVRMVFEKQDGKLVKLDVLTDQQDVERNTAISKGWRFISSELLDVY